MIGNRGRNEPLRIFFPTLSPLGVDDIGVVKIREGDGRVLEENRVIELESKACARGRDGRETCGKCGKSARRGSRVTGRINNGGCFNNLDGRGYIGMGEPQEQSNLRIG